MPSATTRLPPRGALPHEGTSAKPPTPTTGSGVMAARAADAAFRATDAAADIAEHIAAVAAGIRKLRAGRLNEKALTILLHHASGVSHRDIRAVLDAAASLDTTYLKKKG